MSETFYKAVRPDGASFHDPEFRWLPEGWRSGDPIPADWVVWHPNPGARIGRGSGARAGKYLSVATVPMDCVGFGWPCVLLEVEPVGRARKGDKHPNKRHVRAARVLRELPAHEVFGPQGAEVAAILERAARLTAEEVEKLAAAREAAWQVDDRRAAARDAARDAAWGAARAAAQVAAREAAWEASWGAAREAAWQDYAWGAAWDAARRAAWDAATATLSRDLIDPEQHDLLMTPWRAVMGDD